MPLGMEVGLGPGDFVLDGEPAPPSRKRGRSPPPKKKQISAHVYCGQAAGWIKMVLGMEIGLSPGDFVLNGDPARRHKFSAHVYFFMVALCNRADHIYFHAVSYGRPML